jgi:hypothetical protein
MPAADRGHLNSGRPVVVTPPGTQTSRNTRDATASTKPLNESYLTKTAASFDGALDPQALSERTRR